MKSYIYRFVRFASGPLLWANLAIAVAVKIVVPVAGLGLATIVEQIVSVDAMSVIALTNRERVALGMGELVRDTKLDAAAQLKLDDMKARGYFAHLTPDNLQPWDFVLRTGYRYQSAGENLAKGFKDAGALVTAWMGSPSHRANIVSPTYRHTGVAVGRAVIDGKESTVIVQMFAAPLAGTTPSKSVVRATPAVTPVPKIASAPTPAVQSVSTDTRIAGVKMTEFISPTVESGAKAGRVATGYTGAYLALVFGLLSLAFIVTGAHRPTLIAWTGHAFALALLTALPSVALPVTHIF